MRWTKNYPTKEGFYWFRDEMRTEVFLVQKLQEGLSYFDIDLDEWRLLGQTFLETEWSSEPINEPQEEEKSMLSVKERNIKSLKSMQQRAFDRVNNRCILLTQKEFVEEVEYLYKQPFRILNHNIFYEYEGELYYPDFQIGHFNTILDLLVDLQIDIGSKGDMNEFIQFLVSQMDFSGPGEYSNIYCRYKFLDNPEALEIIKRDWIYRFEMGQ